VWARLQVIRARERDQRIVRRRLVVRESFVERLRVQWIIVVRRVFRMDRADETRSWVEDLLGFVFLWKVWKDQLG
jgi:hypothetical protein